MKTKEELNALKEEVETVGRKLHALTDEEFAQVSGGELVIFDVPVVEPPVSEPTVVVPPVIPLPRPPVVSE